MTQALVDRFAQEYPNLPREEVSAAVDAALTEFTQDGLTFKASDIIHNVRTQLDLLEPPTYRRSPRAPVAKFAPKPPGLLQRLWDRIRG